MGISAREIQKPAIKAGQASAKPLKETRRGSPLPQALKGERGHCGGTKRDFLSVTLPKPHQALPHGWMRAQWLSPSRLRLTSRYRRTHPRSAGRRRMREGPRFVRQRLATRSREHQRASRLYFRGCDFPRPRGWRLTARRHRRASETCVEVRNRQSRRPQHRAAQLPAPCRGIAYCGMPHGIPESGRC